MKHDEEMLPSFGNVLMLIIIAASATTIFALWVIS